jgi:hypothetical protein
MNKITSLQAIAGALLALGLSAAPAHAANRTWVSGHGTDSGACTRAAPCATFAFALTQTAAGGEIDVLDPAGYGPVTITKAISIVNDGVGAAGIRAASGNAITINVGASDSVHLRGLTIEGLGSGANGILFTTGGNLAIENCVVRNFSKAGIRISPFIFSVSNTIASNNGAFGIFVRPASPGAVTGVLSKVTANNNGIGIAVEADSIIVGSANVTIVDSEASNNAFSGVAATSRPRFPAPVAVMLRNVVASSNSGEGLAAVEHLTILRVAHSVVTGNGTGVSTSSGGIINSYGDNDINGNTNDNFGALTPLAKH